MSQVIHQDQVFSQSPAMSKEQDSFAGLNFEERMQLAEFGPRASRFAAMTLYPAVGMLGLLMLWWLGGRWVAAKPELSSFSDFAPAPTFAALKLDVEFGCDLGTYRPKFVSHRQRNVLRVPVRCSRRNCDRSFQSPPPNFEHADAVSPHDQSVGLDANRSDGF